MRRAFYRNPALFPAMLMLGVLALSVTIPAYSAMPLVRVAEALPIRLQPVASATEIPPPIDSNTITDGNVVVSSVRVPAPVVPDRQEPTDTPHPVTLELMVQNPYRLDNFNWNIGTDNHSPNVLSELSWQHLQSINPKATAKLFWKDTLYLRGAYDYGWIYDGHSRDSDFFADNRQGEFSRSISKVRGHYQENSLGLGFQLFKTTAGKRQNAFRFAPIVGYAYDTQNLNDRDLVQNVVEDSSGFIFEGADLFHIPGKISTYKTRWYGPWAGYDLSYRLTDRLTLFNTLQFALLKYYGQANWQLRDDFQHPVSFEHHAAGHGIDSEIGLAYRLTQHASLVASTNYQTRMASDGHDDTFTVDFGTIVSPLNKVHWSDWSISLGLLFKL